MEDDAGGGKQSAGVSLLVRLSRMRSSANVSHKVSDCERLVSHILNVFRFA